MSVYFGMCLQSECTLDNLVLLSFIGLCRKKTCIKIFLLHTMCYVLHPLKIVMLGRFLSDSPPMSEGRQVCRIVYIFHFFNTLAGCIMLEHGLSNLGYFPSSYKHRTVFVFLHHRCCLMTILLLNFLFEISCDF